MGRVRRAIVLGLAIALSCAPPALAARWKRVFSDDFTRPAAAGSFPDRARGYAGRYETYAGVRDTSGNGVYDPVRALSVHGGALDVWLHDAGGVRVVGAIVPVWRCSTGLRCGGQAYGRYTVRFRADPVAGYKTAWLLWPDSERWPVDGEIDFPESGGSLDGTIFGALHPAGDEVDDQQSFDTGVTYARWHTAQVRWTPGRVLYRLDGTVVHVATAGVPTTPMHWVLQSETATNGTVPAPGAGAHVYVDWLRVDAYAG
jgi:glycosyl hydrolase family 16